MLKYKGYLGGQIEYDSDLKLFHGRVIGLRDIITFQGRTAEEIEQAFKDSIDVYLEFCAEEGRKPEKPYSGKFLVRTDPVLHAKLMEEAYTQKVSLNALINEILEQWIEEHESHAWPENFFDFEPIADAPDFKALRKELKEPDDEDPLK